MSVSSFIANFFKSPANRTGLIALGSLAISIAVQYAGHNLALTGVVSAAVFGVAKILEPDNAALQADLPQLVDDLLRLKMGNAFNVTAAAPVALDTAAIIEAITKQNAAPVAVPVPVLPSPIEALNKIAEPVAPPGYTLVKTADLAAALHQ